MKIKDSIKELRRVKASELIPNPKNWRTHPVAQQDALKGVLEEVGYADALIARETPDGLMLVDGHLRAETTPDAYVPVLVLDINEEESDLILATLDPLAAMAGRDDARLDDLLVTISSDIDSVNDLLQTLGNGSESVVPENIYSQSITTPIYAPSGDQPKIKDLRNRDKADELIQEIKDAQLPEDLNSFLIDAASRHIGFNYSKIANYYAHAPDDIKRLIENSALVVIDYDKAIEQGFITLQKKIDEAFHEDYPNA